ncbi:MAG: metallopeptidase TldD-related protein [Pseudomonadota bacterium]
MASLEDLGRRLRDAALAAGADAADVIVSEGRSASVGVAAGALEEAESSEGIDVGLRVLAGRGQACVSSSDTRADTLAEMAERAVVMARAAPEDPYVGLADPTLLSEVRDAAGLDLLDPEPPASPARLEEMAMAAEAAALAIPGVVQVEQASASSGADRLVVLLSNGFEGSYARSSASCAVSVIAGEGTGRERDFAFEVRRHAADLPSPEEIGTRAGERTIARLAPKRPPSGHFPVLYDERVAAGLIGHLLSASNGSAIARGASWASDLLGDGVLPAGLSVTEMPHLPRGRASRPFDAEGLRTRDRAIVDKGVLTGWVLDLATARQLGLESTANARRGLSGPPSPGISNIQVTQGALSREALIAEMGTGLLVTNFLGASINATTGAYSRGAGGFWVEGGEIAYPVNEITIAGTLPEMLKTLVPANDADPHKSVSAPSMIVEGLTIGA